MTPLPVDTVADETPQEPGADGDLPITAPDDHVVDASARIPHFQIYLDVAHHGGHWRLLSGNRRELGRSVTAASSVVAVSLDIRDLQRRLPGARPVVRPVEGHRWEWRLVDDAGTLAVSGHAFDRKLRCVRAAAQFVLLAGSAPVARNVISTGSRRGARAVARPV